MQFPGFVTRLQGPWRYKQEKTCGRDRWIVLVFDWCSFTLWGRGGAGANWNSIHDKHRLRGKVPTTYLHPPILTHLNYWDSWKEPNFGHHNYIQYLMNNSHTGTSLWDLQQGIDPGQVQRCQFKSHATTVPNKKKLACTHLPWYHISWSHNHDPSVCLLSS